MHPLYLLSICHHISSSIVKAKLLKLKMNKGTWCRFSRNKYVGRSGRWNFWYCSGFV